MARKATSMTKESDVAAVSPAAENPADTGEVKAAEGQTETPTNNPDSPENPADTGEEKTENGGFPFKTNEDGTVNVWSAKRAGRSVFGSTGEVVTFDEKGFARVKVEDALHFKEVPGFSFKEEK